MKKYKISNTYHLFHKNIKYTEIPMFFREIDNKVYFPLDDFNSSKIEIINNNLNDGVK